MKLKTCNMCGMEFAPVEFEDLACDKCYLDADICYDENGEEDLYFDRDSH